MFARFSFGLALALLMSLSSQAAEPKKDREGNPLPEGAVARFGTLSFRLSTSDQGHGSMAMSHDGKRIAVFESGKVHVWEVETGKTLQQFDYPHQPGYVEPVAISGDGKSVMVFNANSGIQAWDVETGKTLFTHEEVGRSRASMGIGFLEDGTPVYSRNYSNETGNFVALHHAKTKKELTTFKGDLGHSFALDISPNGKLLMGGMFDRANDCVHVRVYDAKTYEVKASIDNVAKGDGCTVAGTCPDGSVLLVVTDNGDITFWSAEEGKLLSKLEEKPLDVEHPVPATLSWDGKIAVVSGWEDGTLRLFDTATGKLIKKLDGAGKGGYTVMSKDGKRVAHRGTDRVQVWNLTNDKEMHKDLPGHRSKPTTLAYSPDGKHLAGESQGELLIWELKTGKIAARWKVKEEGKDIPISSLSYSPDGKYLLSSGINLVTLWDATTGKSIQQWHEVSYNQSCFDPEGRRIYLLGFEGQLGLWDIAEKKILESNPKVIPSATDLAVIPSQNLLVVMSPTGMATYDAKTLKEIRKFPLDEENSSIEMVPSRDGRRFGTLRINDYTWSSMDVKSGESIQGASLNSPVTYFVRGRAQQDRLFAVVMAVEQNPEPACILTLIDTATGKIRHRQNMNFSDISSLAFSPDGRYLASGNSDTTILIWDLWNLKKELENATPELTDDLGECWKRLDDEIVAGVDPVIQAMCSKPEKTLAFLNKQLQPVEKANVELLRKLLDQLESNRFAVREKASKELTRIGSPAVAELRQRRDKATDEDLKTRLDAILVIVDSPFLSGEHLRAYRGIEILERIGTSEAKELLKKLSKGEPDAMLTREAKAALRE